MRGWTVSIRGALTGIAMAIALSALLAATLLFESGDAFALSSCPNAAEITGASTSLPDCRAYEKVSPTEKGGFASITAGLTPVQLSPEGERIAYFGNEAFPGALGNTALLAAHVSARSETGWETTELTPEVPIAEAAKAYVVGYDFSKDVSQAVIRVPLVALTPKATPGVFNLFLRDPSGAYSLVNNAQPTVSAEAQCPVALLAICFFIADFSAYAGASEDESHILFESTSQLTPEAPPPVEEIPVESLYESSGGHVRLVGILPSGSPATSATSGAGSKAAYTTGEYIDRRVENAISKDGSQVVFQAPAGGGEGEPDIEQAGLPEVYDRIDAETTVELSAPAPGPAPAVTTPEPATFWAASQDGSHVFFTSSAELTAQSNTGSENNGADLYEYNVDSRSLKDITVDTNGADATTGPMVQGVVGASSDGSYIYFVALGQLVPGKGVDGQPNLYMEHNGGNPVFIATLSSSGTCSLRSEKSSADSCDWTASPAELEAYVGLDGRHMAFMSTMSLPTANFESGYDNTDQITGEADSEVYEFSAPSESEESGRLICVSCDLSGARPVGNALIGGITQLVESKPGKQPFAGMSTPFARVRALNEAGTRVFYSAPGRQGHPFSQVFEYEQDGEGSCETVGGCQYLISDPTGGANDQFLGTSLDGRDALIATSSRLTADDIDNLSDVYDARAGGGFTVPVAPATCENTCREPGATPSAGPPLLSASTGPSRNLTITTAKPLTRAQKLAKALKACRAKRSRRKRASCESAARRHYGERKGMATRSATHRGAKR